MTFRFFTFFFKNNNKTSQLHPSHHSLFPNLHSLKPHSLWLSWLLQAHIFLKAIGKEIKTSQNMPAIPCKMTSALLSVSLLSDLPEVTSVIPSKTFIVFMNWPITTRTPTLLWPFVFYLECVTPWLWIRVCPCLVCGTYSLINKITVRCIKKSFYPFYACSVFMLGKRKTNKQKTENELFFFEDTFHSGNFVNGVGLVGWWGWREARMETLGLREWSWNVFLADYSYQTMSDFWESSGILTHVLRQ